MKTPRSTFVLSTLLATAALTFFSGCQCLAPTGKAAPTTDWRVIFDGKSLAGWKETDFSGRGSVQVESGELRLGAGAILTGVTYTNAFPKSNYEVEYEAKKIEGSDFFAALTFPVGKAHATFVNGGWGGGVTGISSIDGMDASENDTTKTLRYEKGRWYKFRLRVTPERIEAWVDGEKLVEQPLKDRAISMRAGEIELSVPFGFANFQTSGALRNIRLRTLN
ncbi:MAG: DUF1080 domain-containing protein [Pedosphaera sp.]|nr:DUF1080 domain-containing protein [Pedosphaera sp.]MST00454.1 DUF1080 domain-containing protein [Pedosphaera sp.]